MVGIRTDEKTRASWTRKAKASGMSFNKWAELVLNKAPKVKPATIVDESKARTQLATVDSVK